MMSGKKMRFIIRIHLYLLKFYFVLMAQQCFHQLAGISFYECKEHCNNDNVCLSVRYKRTFQLCKLYDVVQDKQEPGIFIYNKPEDILNDHTQADCLSESSDMTCQRKTCLKPSIPGADMYGNMFDIGSKIKFVCNETTNFLTLTCNLNGTWTPNKNTLSCALLPNTSCMNPGEVPFGQMRILAEFNDTHARLDITCNDGYSLYSLGDILCTKATGTWSGFEQACCKQITKLGWTLVYSSSKSLKAPLINFNATNTDYCKIGLYRNKTVLSNWENLNIKRINFSIILYDEVAKYMLFKGENTGKRSWFSVNNLLESSWSDLHNSTPVHEFSVSGKVADEGNRRWFVAKIIGSDPCTDIGWFVVTRNYYPCNDQTTRGHRILYAKNGHASKFIEGEIGFADRFEIWVEM